MPSRSVSIPAPLACAVALLCACNATPENATSLGSAEGGTQADGSTSATSTSADGTASTTSSTAATTGVDSSDGGPIFDIPVGDLPGNCEDMCGGVEFSYIWIASPNQGNPTSTVAKINTETLTVEGRYYTRPDTLGNASRTSVNLSGRAVAVANRAGGVTKIWARSEDCVDQNGNGLMTSSGEGDVLAWGEDDCVAWYTEFPDYWTQRPIAWSAGEIDPATCTYVDERIWSAGCPGAGGGPIFVHRLDGDTGVVVDTLQIDDLPCTGNGPYGGAVDGDGNFWVLVRGEFNLARVDPDNLDYTMFEIPSNLWGYGIAVDHNGRPWLSGWQANPMTDVGGGRLDPDTGTWDLLDEYDFSSLGGLQEAPDGRMWISTIEFGAPAPNGAIWVDVDTVQIGDQIALGVPLSEDPKGISIDGAGNLWIVTLYGAYKVDTSDLSVIGSTPLPFAYTYSDMTGWGLSNATCPPAG
jgi:hypothetical protein